jgi:hypothetical protein
MNRTRSSYPSPPVGEKVPEGRMRGISNGSWHRFASNLWRSALPMNYSSTDRADIREGFGKLHQVLDCGDGVCAIAALASGAMRMWPNRSQSGDSLRSSPQSKTCESQRDSATKPRVGAQRLPWEYRAGRANPNGVASRCRLGRPEPRWGSHRLASVSQGSSCLATLGFGTKSLWDLVKRPASLWVMQWSTTLARLSSPSRVHFTDSHPDFGGFCSP